jgi:crotonobetainyl-CoA:carnitine CoA-transferase CaiB-like acyl-CoA transferase
MKLPLKGVKVLDLSAFLSGPLATGTLADQGADVIKIEALSGDGTRRIGPAKGDMTAMFIATNRGKRSVAVDLKHAAGREAVIEIARRADVLVENMRPGVLGRLGLGYGALSSINPGLIYLSITGFGQDGPDAATKAYDGVIQATSGVSAAHRDPRTGEPTVLSTAVCDKLTALTASQAICAALFARERSGKGSHVRLAMLDAAVAFQWPDAMYNHVFLDDPPEPGPPFGATLKPWRARDGFFVTNTPQREEFAALCEGLGRPELADDPRFASVTGRFVNAQAMREALEPAAADADLDPLVRRLREAGAPVGAVNELDDVIEDPQVVHNRTLAVVDQGAIGRVRLPRGPAHFAPGEPPVPGPAPRLGEHTREVLRELGYDDARIDALARQGAVIDGRA